MGFKNYEFFTKRARPLKMMLGEADATGYCNRMQVAGHKSVIYAFEVWRQLPNQWKSKMSLLHMIKWISESTFPFVFKSHFFFKPNKFARIRTPEINHFDLNRSILLTVGIQFFMKKYPEAYLHRKNHNEMCVFYPFYNETVS